MNNQECKICNKMCGQLGQHLKIHKIKPYEYYDKFHKKENDGICIVCSNKTSFYSIEKGYNRYCSNKCSNKSELTIKKCVNTWIQKYGTSHPSKLEENKEKRKQTTFNKYGVNSINQVLEIKEKKKITCLQNYGCTSPYKSDIVKNRGKETCQKIYGVDNFSKTPQGRKISSINCIRLIENQIDNNEPMVPHVGDQERPFLNELQKYTSYNIIRQDPSFRYIVGQFPDGHILELKLFIQFDERQHFIDTKCTIYKDLDFNKTLELAALGYIVFRISEKNWKENKEQVIHSFKELINGIEQTTKSMY